MTIEYYDLKQMTDAIAVAIVEATADPDLENINETLESIAGELKTTNGLLREIQVDLGITHGLHADLLVTHKRIADLFERFLYTR